jgi:hypothetical protein
MPAISSIHPRSCLQGSDLHHRADVFRRIAASVLIGQIKKTKIHACHCSSPRVSGQTDSGMSLHDVQRSGRGHFTVSTQPNLLSFLRRIFGPDGASPRSPQMIGTVIEEAPTGEPGWRNQFSKKIGGARRDRTDDILLAKQALSQLSYGPKLDASRVVPARA